VEDVIAEALAAGGGYNISDALTINGQPGFLYNFSSEGRLQQNSNLMPVVIIAMKNSQLQLLTLSQLLRHPCID